MTLSLSIDDAARLSPPQPMRLRRGRHFGSRSMAVLAVTVAALALLPVGFIGWVAIETGWSAAIALIWRPRVGELLVNTLLLELCTVPPAVTLALALAW